ncbi:integrase core domain [Paramuricea clavata]|uniref:Integrase core domain n=1 Tax=Paramuricea clavata TaxID=317549 RepID=A0A7D9J584_PARCT|nr:integrase core domain [Paramuricea clavata]
MAPLPADRNVPAPPFTNVGLDFAGTLYLKNRGEKAYICLFTCAVTRAVHLELVSNMTTERFLLALRRMVARRGMCSIIWSDNAKTFKCAKKELQSCWRILESEETRTALSEKKIQWKFIVPRAPWWGGFYERLVKSVKLPLKKIFGNAMLDAKQMTTILTEIEAQINSRPLTYIGAEPNDLKALTPSPDSHWEKFTGVSKQRYESYGAHFQRLKETITISSTFGKWILEAMECGIS